MSVTLIYLKTTTTYNQHRSKIYSAQNRVDKIGVRITLLQLKKENCKISAWFNSTDVNIELKNKINSFNFSCIEFCHSELRSKNKLQKVLYQQKKKRLYCSTKKAQKTLPFPRHKATINWYILFVNVILRKCNTNSLNARPKSHLSMLAADTLCNYRK